MDEVPPGTSDFDACLTTIAPSGHHHSQEAYLLVRAEFNQLEDRFERAVRFPYLNRFGFNGLFRVNRKGGYNVPYGTPSSLRVFDVERYEAVAAKLSRCLVINGGFAGAIELAGVGDVIYCDPALP